MLDIKFIIQNKKRVQEAILNKKVKEKVNIDDLISLYNQKKDLKIELEKLRAKQNQLSKVLSDENQRTKEAINAASELKTQIKNLSDKLEELSYKFDEIMLKIPNITDVNMPVGEDENDNVVIEKWGSVPEFNFKIRDHVELGKITDTIEIEKAGKISGSRFYYLKRDAVFLQFALITFVIETLQDLEILNKLANKIDYNYKITPFIPVIPPVMMKPEVMKRMDRLDPIDERYELKKDDLILVGSAEHTLGPLLMDEKLDIKDLPIRFIGYSTAFRREAGSYGKDVRGILRTHQFDKLEMETFVPKEHGSKEQKFIVEIQKYLVQSLQIPYQVVQICTGDTGKPDYNQFDIECWIPSQNKYRETHTSDYMTDFQARRLNIRYKDGERTHYVHMNDATAFAIGRIIIAILENFQQKDGSIVIPEVLRKYFGKEKINRI